MPNGSLDNLLATNNTNDQSKQYLILLGIAEGMKHLHNSGIIHRNLHPSNILLDKKLYPHVSDFGYSIISDLLLSSIDSNEISPYLAPEIITNNLYTFKSDVYSFSIIAYHIITGKSIQK